MAKKHMKKGLALGALMAVLITGNAYAGVTLVAPPGEGSIALNSGTYNGQISKQIITAGNVTLNDGVVISDMKFDSVNESAIKHTSGTLTLDDFTLRDIHRDTAEDINGSQGSVLLSNGDTLNLANGFVQNNTNVGDQIKRNAVIRVNAQNMHVKNVEFNNNESKGMGGAFYLSGSRNQQKKFVITNSKFLGNKAYEGAAVFANTHSGNTVNLENNEFIGNVARDQGGALNIQRGAQVKLGGSNKFESNTANKGGAIYVYGPATYKDGNGDIIEVVDGTLTIGDNATFTGNKASEAGGAIYNEGTINFEGNATFTGNTANDVANDIYNKGTINIGEFANVSLEGGIQGTGTVNSAGGTLGLGVDSTVGALAGEANIVKVPSLARDAAPVKLTVNDNSAVDNGIIKDGDIKLTGVDLILTSSNAGAGMLENTTIESDSTVILDQQGTGSALGGAGGIDNTTIKASKIVVSAQDGKAISLVERSGAITLDAKTIALKSTYTETGDSAGGIYLDGKQSKVQLKGFDTLAIDVVNASAVEGEGGAGIMANTGSLLEIAGNEGSTVTVNSEGRSALATLAGGGLHIKAEDLTAKATNLDGGEDARKNSVISSAGEGSQLGIVTTGKLVVEAEEGDKAIGVDAGGLHVEGLGTTEITGDVSVKNGGNVDLYMTGSESYLKGAIETEEGATSVLSLNDGATWEVAKDSNLSVLAGDDANVIVDATDMVNGVVIGDNQNENVKVSVIKDADKGVFDKDEVYSMVVDGEGNSLVTEANVENAVVLADVAIAEDGKTTATFDVDDVVAGGVSLQDTKAAVDAEAERAQDEEQRIEEKFDGQVGRLDNRIDKVEDRVDKVGAMAAAMASLRTMGYDPEAPTEIAVGVGQYRSETGLAIGAFHYPNKNFMLNLSVSTAGDEVMAGIGATWKIGRKR